MDVEQIRESTLSGVSFPRTPRDALEPLVQERVVVAGRAFVVELPERSDHLIDHPDVQSYFKADEYLPYWTELWPAARMLSKVVLQAPWQTGTRVLELGCGLGLPGIAALSKGLKVTFSDCDLTALEFAAANARLNGFSNFDVLPLDWRCPPEGLRFPVVLGSDVVYELRHINPLIALLLRILQPGGLCLLTDQDRLPAYNLRDALDGEGFRYTSETAHAGQPRGRRVKGTVYRITRP